VAAQTPERSPARNGNRRRAFRHRGMAASLVAAAAVPRFARSPRDRLHTAPSGALPRILVQRMVQGEFTVRLFHVRDGEAHRRRCRRTRLLRAGHRIDGICPSAFRPHFHRSAPAGSRIPRDGAHGSSLVDPDGNAELRPRVSDGALDDRAPGDGPLRLPFSGQFCGSHTQWCFYALRCSQSSRR
jgi:hypothetical protein